MANNWEYNKKTNCIHILYLPNGMKRRNQTILSYHNNVTEI